MPNNSSFPSNQPTGQGNMTAKTYADLLLCPPFPNVRFDSLNSSLPYFVNAALNVPLAIATTVTNLVVLLAMRRVTSIRLPSKLLLAWERLPVDGGASVPDHPPCSWSQQHHFSYWHRLPAFLADGEKKIQVLSSRGGNGNQWNMTAFWECMT